MKNREAPPVAAPPPYPADPVIAAYKAGIDRTLIVENLRRSPDERLANLAALQRFVARYRGAALAQAPPRR